MSFITKFFMKFKNSEKKKINCMIKQLIIEYKVKDSSIIYIVELYNKQSINITNDRKLIDTGRKELIIEINKIKNIKLDIYHVLLNDLVKNLIKNNIDKKNIYENILEIYYYESLKITNNINLIEKYKKILIINL